MLGTPIKEALDTRFDVRAETSIEGALEMVSNTLPRTEKTNKIVIFSNQY